MRYKSLFCDRGINDSCIRFFIIHKVLEKNKINSSVISNYKKTRWQFKFYKEAGFNQFFYLSSEIYLEYIIDLFKEFFVTLIIILKNKNNLNFFLNNTFVEKKNFGYLIYDEYLKRTNDYSSEKLNFKFIKILYLSILKVLILKKIIIKNRFNLFFLTENNYINPSTIVRKLFEDDKNKKLINISRGNFQFLNEKTFLTNSYKRINLDRIFNRKFNNEYKKNSKNFFKKRFSGKIDYRADLPLAFKNNNNIRLNKTKKLKILIACHRLSDANHTYPKNIFLNYYFFVKESIDALKESNHQIFIKIHPSSTNSETEMITKLVIKQKTKKIKIIPKNVNTKNILKQINCLITLHGTIAIENAIINKNKAIICADSSYANLGFSKRIKSLFEFKKILRNKNLRPEIVNKNELEIAKRYLFFVTYLI